MNYAPKLECRGDLAPRHNNGDIMTGDCEKARLSFQEPAQPLAWASPCCG